MGSQAGLRHCFACPKKLGFYAVVPFRFSLFSVSHVPTTTQSYHEAHMIVISHTSLAGFALGFTYSSALVRNVTLRQEI